jgi:hypothetical protein
MHSPRIRCSAVRAFASDLRCLGVFCGWLTVALHDNRRIVWHPDDEQILRTTSSFAIHGRPYEFLLPSKCVQNGSLAVVASHPAWHENCTFQVGLRRNVGLQRNTFEGACDERRNA